MIAVPNNDVEEKLNELSSRKSTMESEMKFMQERISQMQSECTKIEEMESDLKEKKKFTDFRDDLRDHYINIIKNRRNEKHSNLLNALKNLIPFNFVIDQDKRTEQYLDNHFSAPSNNLLNALDIDEGNNYIKDSKARTETFTKTRKHYNSDDMLEFISLMFEKIDSDTIQEMINLHVNKTKFDEHALERYNASTEIKEEELQFDLLDEILAENKIETIPHQEPISDVEITKSKEIKKLLYNIRTNYQIEVPDDLFQKTLDYIPLIIHDGSFPIDQDSVNAFFIALSKINNFPLLPFELDTMNAPSISQDIRTLIINFIKDNELGAVDLKLYNDSMFERIARLLSCELIGDVAKSIFERSLAEGMNKDLKTIGLEYIISIMYFLISSSTSHPLTKREIFDKIKLNEASFNKWLMKVPEYIKPLSAYIPKNLNGNGNPEKIESNAPSQDSQSCEETGLKICEKCNLKTTQIYINQRDGLKICFICYNGLESKEKALYSRER